MSICISKWPAGCSSFESGHAEDQARFASELFDIDGLPGRLRAYAGITGFRTEAATLLTEVFHRDEMACGDVQLWYNDCPPLRHSEDFLKGAHPVEDGAQNPRGYLFGGF